MLTKITHGLHKQTIGENQSLRDTQLVLETSTEKIFHCLLQTILEGPVNVVDLRSEDLSPMSDEKAVACLIRNLRCWRVRKQQKQIKELMDKNRARIQFSTFLKKQKTESIEQNNRSKEENRVGRTERLRNKFQSRVIKYIQFGCSAAGTDLKDKAARCLHHFLFNCEDESLLDKFLNTIGQQLFQEMWKPERNMSVQHDGLCLFEALCHSRQGIQKLDSIGSMNVLLEVMIKYVALVKTESEAMKNGTGETEDVLEISLSSRASVCLWGICKAVCTTNKPQFGFTFSTELCSTSLQETADFAGNSKLKEHVLKSVLDILKQVIDTEGNKLSSFVIQTLISAICLLLRDESCSFSALNPVHLPNQTSANSSHVDDLLNGSNSRKLCKIKEQNGLLLSIVDSLLDSSDMRLVQGAIGIIGRISEIFTAVTDRIPDHRTRPLPLPLIYDNYREQKNRGLLNKDFLDRLFSVEASLPVLDHLLRASDQESRIYLATTIWSLARCPQFQQPLGKTGIVCTLVNSLRQWFDLGQLYRIDHRKLAEWSLAALCTLCLLESNQRQFLESWKEESVTSQAITSIKTFGYRNPDLCVKTASSERLDFTYSQKNSTLDCKVGHDKVQYYYYETEAYKRGQDCEIFSQEVDEKLLSKEGRFENNIRELVEFHRSRESASDPLELLVQMTQIKSRKQSSLSSVRLLSLRILQQIASSSDGQKRILKSSAVIQLVQIALDSSLDAESRAAAGALWFQVSDLLPEEAEEGTWTQNFVSLLKIPSQEPSTLSNLVITQIHLAVDMMKSGFSDMEVVGAKAAADVLVQSPWNQDYFIQRGYLQAVLVCGVDLLEKDDLEVLASCCVILLSLCSLPVHQHKVCKRALQPLLDINHRFSAQLDTPDVTGEGQELIARIVLASSVALDSLLQNPMNRDLFFRAELQRKAHSNVDLSTSQEVMEEFQNEGLNSHYQHCIQEQDTTFGFCIDSTCSEDASKLQHTLSFVTSDASNTEEENLRNTSGLHEASARMAKGSSAATISSNFLKIMKAPVRRLWYAAFILSTD
eukprot:g1605.t1